MTHIPQYQRRNVPSVDASERDFSERQAALPGGGLVLPIECKSVRTFERLDDDFPGDITLVQGEDAATYENILRENMELPSVCTGFRILVTPDDGQLKISINGKAPRTFFDKDVFTGRFRRISVAIPGPMEIGATYTVIIQPHGIQEG